MNHVSAAQAATRQVPLKRQCTRQFTDKRRAALKDSLRSRVYPRTCDAAFRDTSDQARRYTRFRGTGFVLAGMSSSMNHVSAAQAATRRVPLKRQCTRQFTDKRRAALKDSLRSRVYPRTCDTAFRDTSGQARWYTRL